VKEDEKFDFCMYNPPFFETYKECEEIHPSSSSSFPSFSSSSSSSSSSSVTQNEKAHRGGENSFITFLLDESLLLFHQIEWFSTLVGKKEDVKKIKKILVEREEEWNEERRRRWREREEIEERREGEEVEERKEDEKTKIEKTRWVLAWKFIEEKIEVSPMKLSLSPFFGAEKRKMEKMNFSSKKKKIERITEILIKFCFCYFIFFNFSFLFYFYFF
jgi:23S rRNA A1618 N6-methylase RlmF